VRASSWVPKKRADLVGRFRRQNMLEFAGLLLDFRFTVHGQAVCEEALCEAMAADDASGLFASAGSELNDQRSITD